MLTIPSIIKIIAFDDNGCLANYKNITIFEDKIKSGMFENLAQIVF